MSDATDPKAVDHNQTIRRHVDPMAQPVAVLPEPSTYVPLPAFAGRADTTHKDTGALTQIAVPEIASVVNDLLRRYVDLLESSGHGGWSREEDETVRTARALLSRLAGSARSCRSGE